MRLGLHVGTLRGFGSGTVGRSIIESIIALNETRNLKIWLPDSWSWRPSSSSLHVQYETVGAGVAKKFILENLRIRESICRGRITKLFSLGDTSLPGGSIPHLLLVQQAYIAYQGHELDFPISKRFALKLRLIDEYFRLALPSIDRITVQTSHMKERLCSKWNLSPQRVVVIPSAVEFPTSKESTNSRSDNTIPYICYVASPSPHKNFAVLADTMAALPKYLTDLRCRLTVYPEDVPHLIERAATLNVLDRFDFLGPLSQPAVVSLLHDAAVVVIPSKLESFGLTYYEAMHCQRPIVAADRPFAREACGEYALYANANRGDEFAAAIANILNNSESTERRIERGNIERRNRSKSWLNIAQSYLEVLEQL